ncbi:hypothetical protein Taro_048408 [Colocasia esculenta]|uniref:Cytochrome P450 77A3 n=1 Tax=Colocasia esculenta TaxID=4460 RepID=A0A843X7V1_COLES|nr:hypothetical protein [Colocasia esculenta]
MHLMAASLYDHETTSESSLSAHTSRPVMQLAGMLVGLALPLLFLLVRRSPSPASSGKNSSWNLPPGPPGWPIVGNLFQVGRSGKPFMHYVRDLLPQYGPIFTLRMGTRTLVVVSSPELAHEALIQKGQVFASRPAENPTRDVFSCHKFTVNSALYGPEWRSLRRNMVSGMLSATRLREFRGVRRDAMDRFVARLRAEADAGGGAVWVLRNARFAVFCILLAMCFGLEMAEEEIINIDQVMKRVLMVLNPRMDDFLPLLAPFFARQRREAMRVRQLQINTLVPLIDRRRAVLRGRPAAEDANTAAPFSYIDTLIDLKVEGRKSSPTDPELVTLLSEFINGGTDTTATAVEWAIARLIEIPAIQERLYEEIAQHVERGRKVDENDLEKMPYLQAFAKELLRRHPPTYFSLTHAVVEATTLGGYDIPPGVNVEFYLPAISEDPRLWKEPTGFKPERFLTGGEDADMMCVTGVRMMPFGAGRRICPGLGMGMTHITLMVARMVQEFQWTAHPDQPGVELDEKLEFTVVMNRTLRAMVRPRN